MKPQSCKAKGRRLQQWVCEQLSRISGIPWGPEDDKLIQSRPMAQRGVDVVLRGEAAVQFPYSFECKSGESFQLVSSIEQARGNAKIGRPWVVVHRRQAFAEPLVMMDWSTFENLLDKPKNNLIGLK